MDKKQFVPKDFAIPAGLETEQFRLRMLSVDDVEKDYDAVMETQGRFLSMGYDWPRVGFTIEENLADLEGHQQEFLNREAFAYTVVSPDEKSSGGVCLYQSCQGRGDRCTDPDVGQRKRVCKRT